MSGFFRSKCAWAVIFLLGAVTISCKRKEQAAASDLKEAGYELTTEDWFRASREGNVEVMKRFVAGNFAPDTRDAEGNTAMHEAAAAGSEAAGDYLLRRGLSLDLKNQMERTPLMEAVIADQTAMTSWLLRQGADPGLTDQEGYTPLMLAAREGSAGAIGELAPYRRQDLDRALLLASFMGNAKAIDALTNHGASVYAKMEDGRTPLMLAAENGHREAAELLLDIGASRHATDSEGRTAAELAEEAGFPEIVEALSREARPEEFVLQTPEEIAVAMEEYIDAAVADTTDTADGEEVAVLPLEGGPVRGGGVADVPSRSGLVHQERPLAGPIDGAVIGSEVATRQTSGGLRSGRPADWWQERASGDSAVAERTSGSGAAVGESAEGSFPPLIMRHYRESEVPMEVTAVRGNAAVLRIKGSPSREVRVNEGEQIPGSRLVVVSVQRRAESSKMDLGSAAEVAVVEVRDSGTGQTREWISGSQSYSHDPVALVEDAETGRRYTAVPGQRFRSADGSEYVVSDVRPNQIVIEEVATGVVETFPLRGPRG